VVVACAAWLSPGSASAQTGGATMPAPVTTAMTPAASSPATVAKLACAQRCGASGAVAARLAVARAREDVVAR
jgi:hypothetical protein